jgi:hypothetical protein
MANFKKLKNNFVIDNYTLLNLQTSYSVNGKDDFKGIAYYNVDSPSRCNLYSILPDVYHNDFYFSLLKINTGIPAHTDSADKTVINFYVDPGKCITQFYKLNTSSPRLTQVKNQTDGYLFDLNDLVEVNSFIAEPTEAWILDTTQPHSVIPPLVDFSERIALQLGTAIHSFDSVVKMLQETGNL